MSRLPLPLALCAALLSGCATDYCGDDVASWIEVGASHGDGDAVFVPITDGAVLAVERGSQGGQHVWAALRARGLDPGSEDISEGLANDDLPWVEFQLESDEGVHSSDNLLRRPLDRTDGPEPYGLMDRQVQFRHWVSLPPDWADQDMGEVEAALEEVDFTLRVILEDACGDTLTDEVIVRLDFPPRG